jgi:hypothetical protein
LTGVGKAAGVIAGVGAAIVIYQIAMALDDVKVNGVAAETTLLDLQTEVEKTGKVSVKSFADAANATKSFLDVVGLAFGAGQVGGTPSIDLGGEIIQIQRATDLLKLWGQFFECGLHPDGAKNFDVGCSGPTCMHDDTDKNREQAREEKSHGKVLLWEEKK